MRKVLAFINGWLEYGEPFGTYYTDKKLIDAYDCGWRWARRFAI